VVDPRADIYALGMLLTQVVGDAPAPLRAIAQRRVTRMRAAGISMSKPWPRIWFAFATRIPSKPIESPRWSGPCALSAL
jgi:hypothetical protein